MPDSRVCAHSPELIELRSPTGDDVGPLTLVLSSDLDHRLNYILWLEDVVEAMGLAEHPVERARPVVRGLDVYVVPSAQACCGLIIRVEEQARLRYTLCLDAVHIRTGRSRPQVRDARAPHTLAQILTLEGQRSTPFPLSMLVGTCCRMASRTGFPSYKQTLTGLFSHRWLRGTCDVHRDL